MIQANVIAMSGRAVEAAGDVDILLLDKTGTITLGNRQATAFIPAPGMHVGVLADAAQLASLADETPEGRSIMVLAKEKYGLRARDIHTIGATFVPFTAQTRMSGVDLGSREIRKGLPTPWSSLLKCRAARSRRKSDRSLTTLQSRGQRRWWWPTRPRCLRHSTERYCKGRDQGTLCRDAQDGHQDHHDNGDNPLTAAAVAAEAGVDDFLAEATPEAKLRLIREYQKGGRLVAMTGDGTNDAPALAQADVA